VQPQAIALLDASTVAFLDSVYNGTICRTATTASVARPVPAGFAVDPSGSNPTSPYGACDPPSGGCITAQTIFGNTIGFGTSQYSGEASIELDAYDGATGSWTVTATNFNNNHGSSWGMNPSTGLTTYPDHNGYWMDAFRANAFWQWLDANPVTTALNLSGERVHIGATGSGSYCYFGEYDFSGSNTAGGWCATP
jgi:hypothetical protein